MNRLRASIAAVFLAFAPACSLLYDAGTFATVAGDSSVPAKEEGLTDATKESAAVVIDADAQDLDSSAPGNDLDRTLYPADASYWERAANGNGHGYFVVRTSGRIDWPLARDAAARVPRGHLATFETFEEYLFVKDVVAAAAPAFVVRNLKRLGPWVGLERIAPGFLKLGWVTNTPYVHDAREWSSGEPSDEPPGEPYVAFLGFTTSSALALHDAIAAEDINAYVVEVE